MSSSTDSQWYTWFASEYNNTDNCIEIGSCTCSPKKPAYASTAELPAKLILCCGNQEHYWKDVTLHQPLQELGAGKKKVTKTMFKNVIDHFLGLYRSFPSLKATTEFALIPHPKQSNADAQDDDNVEEVNMNTVKYVDSNGTWHNERGVSILPPANNEKSPESAVAVPLVRTDDVRAAGVLASNTLQLALTTISEFGIRELREGAPWLHALKTGAGHAVFYGLVKVAGSYLPSWYQDACVSTPIVFEVIGDMLRSYYYQSRIERIHSQQNWQPSDSILRLPQTALHMIRRVSPRSAAARKLLGEAGEKRQPDPNC